MSLRIHAFGYFLLVALLTLLPLSDSALALEQPFDHSNWDAFLQEFVNEKGETNYRGVQENPALLNQYLKDLTDITDPYFRETWPREELLALWLNAYHAAIVKAVIEKYPVHSLNAIPGVWDLDMIQVGLIRYSINHIRERELLGRFRDEKIHLALSCGAKNCPRLRREAYTGPRVEGQLYVAAREFVQNEAYVRADAEKKRLYLSKIFQWHAEDFRLDFGLPGEEKGFTAEEYAVLSFIAYYHDSVDMLQFLEEGKFRIKYVSFNWGLNEWLPSETASSESAPSKSTPEVTGEKISELSPGSSSKPVRKNRTS